MRFPGFTDEWETFPLSHFFDFKNGLNPDVKRFGKGVKFISVSDILNNDFIDYDKVIASVEPTDKDLQDFGVNYGDILFQRSSETLEDIGRANVYIDNKAALFGGFVIRGKRRSDYVPFFMRYALSASVNRKKIIVKGAGAQHFNIGQDGLSKVLINVPSNNEQFKIGTLLALLDRRIATQNKIIEDLKKLKSALHDLVFNRLQCEKRPLTELVDIIKGQQVNGELLYDSGKYYVMNGGIEPSGYLDDYNTPAETISISEGGNSCGYVQWNETAFWSGGHCYTLHIKGSSISPRYLYHFLKWKEDRIMKLRIGSGLPNIQKKELAKILVSVPLFDEQKNITRPLESINSKIQVEIELLQSYASQKQYLLSQMFI